MAPPAITQPLIDPLTDAGQGTPGPRFSIRHRRGAWRDALRRRMLAAADLVAVVAAFGVLAATGAAPPLIWCLLLLPLWVVLSKLHGLYDQDHRVLRHLTVDELPGLLTWATTASATHLMALSLLAVPAVTTATAIRLWLAVVVLAPLLRAAARGLWRRIVPAERALLVGSGPLEVLTRRKLELFRDIHVDCVGEVDDAELLEDPANLRLHEALRDLAPVDRIIVVSQSVGEDLIADLVRVCRSGGTKLSVVPPARGMFGTAVQLHHIADLPMIEYSTWDTARSTMLIKRCLDIAVAAAGLLVLSPLLLLIALAVRLDSRGPALFGQLRGGLLGRPFRMYKFRTMTVDAEARLSELVDLDELADPMFKLRRDPRVTAVGRLLRRTSLDELPQLINVLKGDMSLVGPRPEQLDLVERYAPEHRFRLAVRPGITGPMQVFGRGELRFDERLAVDREYVENLSLRRDLRILLLTFAAVLFGRGAF